MSFPNVPSFWKMNKDDRSRITDDSQFPTEIGGRDPNVVSIAWSVYDLIRKSYPVNKVPPELIEVWQQLEQAAKAFESHYEAICERICADELASIETSKTITGNHVT